MLLAIAATCFTLAQFQQAKCDFWCKVRPRDHGRQYAGGMVVEKSCRCFDSFPIAEIGKAEGLLKLPKKPGQKDQPTEDYFDERFY